MVYAVLDGFDLGVGVVHLLVARSEMGRRMTLRSIGPVWDGNEVWLIAGGGVLFFAFPTVYAVVFSGFYLPLMIVLWLLVLRGVAIEFRNHVESLVWQPLWDVIFAGASTLLALIFGAALGNLLRGVPLNQSGFFFLPLWTDLRVSGEVGVLDWFTIMLGLASLVSLTMHGALWLSYKSQSVLEERARNLAGFTWWGVVAFSLLLILVVPLVDHHFADRFLSHPWSFLLLVIAGAGLVGVRLFNNSARPFEAFVSSCLYIAVMLTSAAFGLYPCLLRSNLAPAQALTIHNGATSAYGLSVGLCWFVPGLALAGAYSFCVYKIFSGKVRFDEAG